MTKAFVICAITTLCMVCPSTGGAYEPGIDLGGPDCSVAARVAQSRDAAESWIPPEGLTMEMKAAADAFLQESVGGVVFQERFLFDPLNTDSAAEQLREHGGSTGVFVYWFLVASDPDAAGLVSVLVSQGSDVIGAMGVPDCGTDGTGCELIDHESAIASARASGIPAEVQPPRWKLKWLPSPGYCYSVAFVLGEDGDSYECEEVVVDARTGEVLAQRGCTYEKNEASGTAETPN